MSVHIEKKIIECYMPNFRYSCLDPKVEHSIEIHYHSDTVTIYHENCEVKESITFTDETFKILKELINKE